MNSTSCNNSYPSESQIADYATDNLPKDLLHPGGLVEQIMNYVNDTAICQQPMFALAAALTLCGLLFGRRYADTSQQRTNLFCMGVGYTSAGKDYAIKSIVKILTAGGGGDLWISQVTSDSALEHGLSRQPRLSLLIDEAGHFFSNCSDIGSGAALRSIKPSLLQLWSSAFSAWKGKQRAPQRDKPEIPVEILCPHVCLLGMTQPQTFFSGMSRLDVQDGWLARPIFFISTTRPPARLDLPQKEIPREIVATVESFKDEPLFENNVKIVPSTDNAKDVLRSFGEKVREIMLKSDGDRNNIAALYGKAVENARRVALTLAVSRNRENPVIDIQDMTYGVTLLDYTIRAAVEAIEDNLAENELEKSKKRLLTTIREAGASGILRKELTRKSQYLNRSVRNECLDDLIEAGQVRVLRTGSGAELFKIP